MRNYSYNDVKTNAVEVIKALPESITTDEQIITYTPSGMASRITEGDKQVDFTYGPDDQRRISVFTDGEDETTTIYGDRYERVNDGSGATNNYYIGSPNGLVAMVIGNNVYFTITDHLGSITGLVDQSCQNMVEEASFDAWGRRRNPSTWTYENIPEPDYLTRGFTGHENLYQFGLINMNGRMYDPALGRFLSPDNYVQLPFHTQSYNRYSYVVNNPLRYVDPSGFYRMHNIWAVGYEIDVSDNSSISRYNTDYLASDGRGGAGGGGGGKGSAGYTYSNGIYRDPNGDVVSWQEAIYGNLRIFGGSYEQFGSSESNYTFCWAGGSDDPLKNYYEFGDGNGHYLQINSLGIFIETNTNATEAYAFTSSEWDAKGGWAYGSSLNAANGGGFDIDFQGDSKLTIGVQAGGNVGGLGGQYGIFGNLISVTLLGNEGKHLIYPTSQQGGRTQVNQGISGGLIVGAGGSHTLNASFSEYGLINV